MTEEQEDEFVRLVADHQAMIRAFIISLLPGAPGVDDVIQETNSVLWRKRETFELGTNFKAWSVTVARFQAMRHRKTLMARRWVTLDENTAEMVSDEMEDMLGDGSEEARHQALQQCLEKLRDRDRDLILHRYWRKTRLQDFAVATGRSLNGVKVSLFRIRAGLKKCIQREMREEGMS